jgi:phospholipid/cholesterol/gamma-HCH transport system permease protein
VTDQVTTSGEVDSGTGPPGVLTASAASAGERGADPFDRAGKKVGAAFGQIGDLSAMVLDATVATAEALIRRRFPWPEFWVQMWFLISVTFLPTLLISIPFGLVIVLEVGGLAQQIGATSIVGAVDSLGIVAQAAPVITAILLSGAGGSAICSDLGARTMRDEIDAMWVMAIDPIERLVAPRVLATILVALLLNGIVAFAGIMSGYFCAVFILHTSAGGFLSSFSIFAQPSDFIQSELKAAIFGLLAAAVASHQGLRAKRGPAGIGEAVNRSVVINGVSLFVLNVLITQIFYVITPPKTL